MSTTVPPSPLAVGSTFHTMDDAISAARVHAHKASFSYKIADRNKKRSVLKCSGDGCAAYIRIHYSTKIEQFVIGKFLDDHSCQGSLQAPRGSQRHHEFLVSLLQNGFAVNKDTKVKEIQQYFKHQSGIEIPYTTAHKAKEAVMNESTEAQREQFSLLHSYVEELKIVDPDTMADLSISTESAAVGVVSRFQSVFVAPGAARHAFRTMRRFIAVDGTFTKNRFIQTLLLAVGMDAEDQIQILAWAIVPNECQETWTWFLKRLDAAYPTVNDQRTVIINDREKGLLNAIALVLPDVFNAFCCWHIASNIQARFGIGSKRSRMSSLVASC